MSSQAVLKRMDEIVDAFCKRNRFQTEPLTADALAPSSGNTV
jgi:hypothetical protein